MMTAGGQMIVYVVMGNDFPGAVFSSFENAETYCEQQRAKGEGNAKRIYWRTYDFKLDLVSNKGEAMDDVEMVLDATSYRKLKAIEKRLYDDKPLSKTERRNLAKALNTVLYRVIATAHGN